MSAVNATCDFGQRGAQCEHTLWHSSDSEWLSVLTAFVYLVPAYFAYLDHLVFLPTLCALLCVATVAYHWATVACDDVNVIAGSFDLIVTSLLPVVGMGELLSAQRQRAGEYVDSSYDVAVLLAAVTVLVSTCASEVLMHRHGQDAGSIFIWRWNASLVVIIVYGVQLFRISSMFNRTLLAAVFFVLALVVRTIPDVYCDCGEDDHDWCVVATFSHALWHLRTGFALIALTFNGTPDLLRSRR